MKNLFLILTLIFSTLSFAQNSVEAINFDQDKVIEVVDKSIGEDLTCLDEYLLREKQLKRFLIWAPPATLVGAPVAFVAAGYTSAAIATAAGASGWNAIGYTILGAFGAGAAAVGTFLTMETVKGIQFASMRRMTNLIVASHTNRYDSKALYRLNKKYNRKYPQDNITTQDLASAIVMLDETGMLCDGEVRGNLESKKLKHKLARRKDLIKYIHNNLNL